MPKKTIHTAPDVQPETAEPTEGLDLVDLVHVAGADHRLKVGDEVSVFVMGVSPEDGKTPMTLGIHSAESRLDKKAKIVALDSTPGRYRAELLSKQQILPEEVTT